MKRIKKLLKYLGIIILVYLFLCLSTPFNNFLKKRSIKNQINYLSDILDAGYDDKLQERFPEGKLFSNSILALSIIEFCENNSLALEKYSIIVDKCVERILSDQALNAFDPGIKPKYGMFYNGWTNYVLAKYQKSELFKYSSIKPNIKKESEIIQKRIIAEQTDSLSVLDTYLGSNWPADNLIGLISIDNDTLQQQWLNKIFESAEHESGLIHHSGGLPFEIRGSSQAMMSFCLNEMEYSQVIEYCQKFEDLFIDEYLGVQLVKESEDGSNHMDVDSGPVVWGYGASATIMNIKTQASLKNKNSKRTWAIMNLISCPIHIFGSKYYLFKQEPMLDLFMLWGSVEVFNMQFEDREEQVISAERTKASRTTNSAILEDTTTITLEYFGFMCDCPQWLPIEDQVRYKNSLESGNAISADSLFIRLEPFNEETINPFDLTDKDTKDYVFEFKGQFYKERKKWMSEDGIEYNTRVFRYFDCKLIK